MGNQGKACDAIVRCLEARTQETRTDISHPEKDGAGAPVELRFRLGMQSYAIEHTQVETFAGQIRRGRELLQLIQPVIEELSGNLPKPGVYYVYFPTDARVGVKVGALEGVRRDLIEWVRKHAQHLHARDPDRPTRERNPHGIDQQYRATPPGFPYEVILRRKAHWSLSPRHDGVLLPGHFAPEERRSAPCRPAAGGPRP